MEWHRRSIAKALTWRAIATITTMSLVYVFTGEIALTLGVGALDVSLKLFFYYFHERGWNKVTWGRNVKK
jgi:adenylylsulfate kinase